MQDIYQDHERLIAVLDDEPTESEGVTLEDGIVFVRQATDNPLYALYVDDDLLTIIRTSDIITTTELAREARRVAARHRAPPEDTDEEPIEIDTAAFH
jgi:hypothetical protein